MLLKHNVFFFCSAVARAAALGLPYPGVHGAPDFQTPAHHVMHPGTLQPRPQPYENNHLKSGETESNTVLYRRNQPAVRTLDDRAHAQAHAGSSESTFLLNHGTYSPVQSEYTINQAPSLPREHSAGDRISDFEQVKHAAPSARVEAPGQPDLVNRDPQGRSKPLSFVYNKLDLAVDESVPNRRGMSPSGLFLPRSRGHSTYQRGPTGFGLGREVPVLASPRSTSKGHIRRTTGRSPVIGRWERMRFPEHVIQSLHRNLNVKPFVQGKPIPRRLV